MGISIVAAAAVFFVVAGTLLYLIIIYNGLVRLRNDSNRAWANIDVLLKQRHDEIPNLVETVKGYLQHERQTLVAVTQARAASISAASIGQKAQANLMLTGALRGLFAVAENYPQLRSNENFLRLQDELAGTENRISVERRHYNEAVQDYNTYIGLFPNNIYASWAGFKPNTAYFTAAESSREAPKVQFPGPATTTPTAPAPVPATK